MDELPVVAANWAFFSVGVDPPEAVAGVVGAVASAGDEPAVVGDVVPPSDNAGVPATTFDGGVVVCDPETPGETIVVADEAELDATAVVSELLPAVGTVVSVVEVTVGWTRSELSPGASNTTRSRGVVGRMATARLPSAVTNLVTSNL